MSSKIPLIDLSANPLQLQRGTAEWQHLSKKVREACENYGCFEVTFDKNSTGVKDETFSLIRQLFQLPLEIKLKNDDPRPYYGYQGPNSVRDLYESFGIGEVTEYDSIKRFAEQLWPHGIDQFCKTFSSMIKQVEELQETIVKLIIDGYGLGEKLKTILPCTTVLRMMKYKAPPPGEVRDANGLCEHTDKTMNTFLAEDGISGLDIKTKDDIWFTSTPSPNSLIFLAGDTLMVWSNERIHAVKHRVTMRGYKDRYSFAAFQIPVKGTIIKPPQELLDENQLTIHCVLRNSTT